MTKPFITLSPPSGAICRVSATDSSLIESAICPDFQFRQVPIFSAPNFTCIENLPVPEEGKIFIVSGFVAAAMRAAGMDRPDVVVPGTGPKDNCIRENGRIVAVTRFVRAT